jgi:hypothetical protein
MPPASPRCKAPSSTLWIALARRSAADSASSRRFRAARYGQRPAASTLWGMSRPPPRTSALGGNGRAGGIGSPPYRSGRDSATAASSRGAIRSEPAPCAVSGRSSSRPTAQGRRWRRERSAQGQSLLHRITGPTRTWSAAPRRNCGGKGRATGWHPPPEQRLGLTGAVRRCSGAGRATSNRLVLPASAGSASRPASDLLRPAGAGRPTRSSAAGAAMIKCPVRPRVSQVARQPGDLRWQQPSPTMTVSQHRDSHPPPAGRSVGDRRFRVREGPAGGRHRPDSQSIAEGFPPARARRQRRVRNAGSIHNSGLQVDLPRISIRSDRHSP